MADMADSRPTTRAVIEREADAARIARDADRVAERNPDATAALRDMADLTAAQARDLRARPC